MKSPEDRSRARSQDIAGRQERQRTPAASLLARLGRKRLRMILLVGLPALAALIGLGLYLSGGRYISTDNAYVGAQKVLITPDISDKIIHVAFVEGQHVKPGDELFTLDPEPFGLALDSRRRPSSRPRKAITTS